MLKKGVWTILPGCWGFGDVVIEANLVGHSITWIPFIPWRAFGQSHGQTILVRHIPWLQAHEYYCRSLWSFPYYYGPFSSRNVEEDDLDTVGRNGWSSNVSLNFLSKVYTCFYELLAWGHRIHTRFKNDIKKCKDRLEILRYSDALSCMRDFKNTREDLNLLLS